MRIIRFATAVSSNTVLLFPVLFVLGRMPASPVCLRKGKMQKHQLDLKLLFKSFIPMLANNRLVSRIQQVTQPGTVRREGEV